MNCRTALHRTLPRLVLRLSLAATLPLAAAQPGGHQMVDPGALSWGAVPSLPRGAQLAVIEGPMNEAVPFTVRLKFPAGYRIPPHWHPAVERVTVLSGTFHMGMGERFDPASTRALAPGAIAIMPARSPHYAWTDRETVVQLHGTGPWGITYLNPADDPRGTPSSSAAPLSREQVRAESAQAQRAGELLAAGEAGLPRRLANPAAVAGGPPGAPSARAAFERGGANPWSITYNPLRGFNSTASRAEVRQRYVQDREQAEALTGEDSGSAYLATGQR